MSNHLRFVARTIMVQEGNLDVAYKTLNRNCVSLLVPIMKEVHERFHLKSPFVNGKGTVAFGLLWVLAQDGLIEDVKRKRYFEKPCRERQRKNFENCKRVYNTDMARKISFISRTYRDDAWVGC